MNNIHILEDILSLTNSAFTGEFKLDNGKLSFVGKISHTVTIHSGARYSSISVQGSTPENVIENIVKKITDTNSCLLLGSYNSYHTLIKWDGSKFVSERIDATTHMVNFDLY